MQLKQFLTKPLSQLTYVKPPCYSFAPVKHMSSQFKFTPPYFENNTTKQSQLSPEETFQNIMDKLTPCEYDVDLRTLSVCDKMFTSLLAENYEYVKTNHNVDMNTSKILKTFSIKINENCGNGYIILHENNIAEVVQPGSGRIFVDHMIISIK